MHGLYRQHFVAALPDFSSDRVNWGILALSVEDNAGGGADRVIDRYSSGLICRSFLGMLRSPLLADTFFVSLVMSAVRTSIGIPAGFDLGFVVTQLGALETVVGDFLGHLQARICKIFSRLY